MAKKIKVTQIRDGKRVTFLTPDKGKPGKTPKDEQWYEPSGVESGWKKDMPEGERRRLVLKAHKGDELSSARSMQAKANVTTDGETKQKARADAQYFFKRHRIGKGTVAPGVAPARLESEEAVQGLVNKLRVIRQQELDGVITRKESLNSQIPIIKQLIEVEPLDIGKTQWRTVLEKAEKGIPVTPEPKAGKLISQKQVKVNVINKAIARSAYAREKGVYAELRKDGIIEYSRIYPERPESRMKISFMEMLNTLEGEDIRHLHKLYSTKEIVKLPKRKVLRITQKTPKLRR